MLGLVFLRDQPRVGRFGKARFGKGHCKGLQGYRADSASEGDQAARINAATQKQAYGHIAHQVLLYRLLQAGAHRTGQLRRVAMTLLRCRDKGRRPVSLRLHHYSARVNNRVVARLHTANIAHYGSRCLHSPESQITLQARGIYAARDQFSRQQRAQFRAKEQESIVALIIIQRLDAQTVHRQQQPLGTLIPKGKGEHAVQFL